jgi:GH15 family glucan-1,4-alpha-glucosidase
MTDNSALQIDTTADNLGRLGDPTFHLDVIDELVHTATCDGAVPLASFPDNRYPYAYPRDIACITRAWLTALRHDTDTERCRNHIVDAARFMIAVQSTDGQWQQRYALDGSDKAIYIQEDNVAHGLRILAHVLLALDETDAFDTVEETFLENVVGAAKNAVTHARDELYDPNAHLVESTTSIHEGRIESGYTLWVNSTFVAGLRQLTDGLDRLETATDIVVDSQTAEAVTSLRDLLEGGLVRAFTSPEQVPRRYDPEGTVDNRPDVTLFAPYYYDLFDLFGEKADEAATRAATALEDPELGGLQRFLGFYQDYEVHQHGGNGPWLQYTAWHAQYEYERGDDERGDDILQTTAAYADEDGYIPEHLTTRERFEAFVDNEWDTGFDFEKEFDEAVLRDVSFDLVVEELGHMKTSYQEIGDTVDDQDVVGFARPLTWSHAEFLVALLHRDAE